MSDERRWILRCTWPVGRGAGTACVGYWVDGEPYAGFADGPPWQSFEGRVTDRTRLRVTDTEVVRWRDAMLAYATETVSAADMLWEAHMRAHRRWWARKLPLIGRRIAHRLRRTEDACTARLAAADAVYAEVRAEIEARIAAVKEEARAAREREQARAEAGRLALRAEWDRWKKRQADAARAADLRVWTWEHDAEVFRVLAHDAGRHAQAPLSARELARLVVVLGGRGCRRVEWEAAARRPAEEVIGAEAFGPWWWALVRVTVNTQALRVAERDIVATTVRVGAALDAAGRPGIGTYTATSYDSVRGWPLTLRRPTHVPPPRVTPPTRRWAPDRHRWWYGSYEAGLRDSGTLVLTMADRAPGSVGFAVETTETVYHQHKRKKWLRQTPERKARSLLDDKVRSIGDWRNEDFDFRLSDYAAASEFVPFVQALADMVTSALLDTARRHGVSV
ncbi:hypothetical protein [Streptomyces sp. NPDC053367]|uniref:hypothetical protein n=1 Tax=Streptomyces sp. NPDC053367 TaxID=3365700 RepID=UPI0037D260E3